MVSLMFQYKHFNNTRIKERGVSLIEILVAVVIISVGLLGLASMQMTGLRSNQSAYLRSQASMLASDMADRMRINSAQAIAGAYNAFSTSGYSVSNPGCSTGNTGCTPASQVVTDKVEWTAAINGTNSGVPLLPSGTGTITRGAGNLFTITVQWQETNWNEGTSQNTTQTNSFIMNFSL